MSDLVRELRAKAQQSTRTDKRWDDHVAWRGADEIERLSAANAELLEALEASNSAIHEAATCLHDVASIPEDRYGLMADKLDACMEDNVAVLRKAEGTD